MNIASRSETAVGQKYFLDGKDGVTVVPTSRKLPPCEVNVMFDVTGSVMTVLVTRLETEKGN